MRKSVGESDSRVINGVSVFERFPGDLEDRHVGLVVLIKKVEEELGTLDAPEDVVEDDPLVVLRVR